MRLDGEPRACQSRTVKSCGPSGSQDLAFCGAKRSRLAAAETLPSQFARSVDASAHHACSPSTSNNVSSRSTSACQACAGAKFENGVLVERPDESASGDTHAA